MKTNLRWMVAAIVVASLDGGAACGGDAPAPTWSPAAAAKYLDGRADAWLAWSGAARGQGTTCISCHTTLPFALARPALAASLGETRAGATENKFIVNLKKRVENWDKSVADSTSGKERLLPFYPKRQ